MTVHIKVTRRRRYRKAKVTVHRGEWGDILRKVAGRNHESTQHITFALISESEYHRRMHPRLF